MAPALEQWRGYLTEPDESPSSLIDATIAEFDDWRGDLLAKLRTLIQQADPDVVEEVEWRKPSNSMRGVPTWEHDGETADDVIQAQDQHRKDMVADGDDSHGPARDDMKGRWKRPISGIRWYLTAKKDFASLPES